LKKKDISQIEDFYSGRCIFKKWPFQNKISENSAIAGFSRVLKSLHKAEGHLK